MDITEIPTRLAALAQNRSLSGFARTSKVPLRTLQRIAAGGGNPTLSKMQEIAEALKTYKAPRRKLKASPAAVPTGA